MSSAVEALVRLCQELLEEPACPRRAELREACAAARNEDPLASKFEQANRRFRAREEQAGQ